MQFNVKGLKLVLLLAFFTVFPLPAGVLQSSQLVLTENEKAWLKMHPEVTMAIPVNFPRSYYGMDGTLQGLGIDYIRLIEKKVGIRFQPIVSDWHTALNRAMAHKVDTILNADKLKYREPYLNFTQVYFVSPQTLVAPEKEALISDLSEFCGRKIAVHKGSSRAKYLEQYYPCIELVQVQDKKDVLAAIMTQKADAGLDNFESIMGNLQKMMIPGLKVIYFKYMPPSGFARIGVRKDKPVLASILNKAVLSISQEEKTRIITKRLGVMPPPLPSELTKKMEPSIDLTPDEQAWIAKKGSIKIGFNVDMPPLLIQNENLKHTGILPDLFARLESVTGLNISVELSPRQETVTKAKQKRIDGMLLCEPAVAKALGLSPTRGYISTIPVVFGKKDASFTINSMDDLKTKRIVHLNSLKFIENIAARYGDEKRIVKTDSFIAALTMVLEDKADVALGLNFDTYTLHQSVLTGIEPLFVDHSNSTKAVIAVPSDQPLLVSILNKGLDAIGGAQIVEIVKNWTQFEPSPLKVGLTDAEKIWLQEHPVIRVGANSAWAPIEFLDNNGNYKGVSIDYLKKIEPLLGIRFKFIQKDWQELISLAKHRELDLFPCLSKTFERDKYLIFTNSYIQMPAGIFAKKDVAYLTDFKKIIHKKIAVVEGYAVYNYLSTNYPEVDLILVKTPEEGVRKVLQGKAFVFIDNIITTGHLISRKGYLDVKMVGEIPFDYAQCMGIRKDWPQLRDILQKALDTIPDSDLNAIYNQWVPVIYEKPTDYSLFWKIGTGCLIFIGLIGFWNRRLKFEVARKTAELVLSENRLKAIFNHRFQLTGLLSFDGKVLMANENVCRILGVDFKEIEQQYLWSLPRLSHSPELKSLFQDSVKKAQEGNLVNFETTHPDSEGNIRYIDFSLTPVFGEDGKVRFIVPEGHDNTERKLAEQSLSQSEERLALALDSVSDAVWDWDIRSGGVYYSSRWYTMLGYDPYELPQELETWKRLLHPDDAMNFEKTMSQSQLSGNPFEIEFRMQTKDRLWKWILGRGKTVSWDEKGSPLRMVGTHFDLTERKRNQELQTVCLELNEFSYNHTVRQTLTRFIDQAERLTGSEIGFFHFVEPNQDFLSLQVWSTNTLSHMCTTRLDNAHYPISEAGVWVDAVRKERPLIYNDYQNLSHRKGLPKGHAKIIRQLVVPIFREKKIVAVLGVGNKPTDYTREDIKTVTQLNNIAWDIVLKKRAEADLQESEAKYRSIMESMDDATFICNADFQIEYMNPAMITRCGKDLTGEKCFKAIHGMETRCPWCDIDNVMKGKSTKAEITSLLDGLDYHISSSPIYHEDGVISKLSVLRNITEIKRIEHRLQQAQKMEAIGSLAGGIAHDFNNILFPIVGMAEMLIDDLSENSEEQQCVKEILRAGQRAGDLVKQILMFSRQTEHEVMPIQIQSVLKEALKLCRSSIPSDIEITEDIQRDCGLVEADATQIHQVAMNLITNAYHAVEKISGKILVRLRQIHLIPDDFPGSTLTPGAYVQLTVSDTGCGIEPTLIDKIFDPYFTTKEQGKGTGLGLATVYGIVKDCQGDIKVYSEVGKGSAFNVFLPVIKQACENDVATQDETPQTGTERLLLVDDEKSIVELGKRVLGRLGYQVSAFTSSLDALNAFSLDPYAYDMVITDMTMPKMTGDLLSKKLRELRPDIPILICTGFSERINKENIDLLGIDGILMKPITNYEIAKAVRDILDSKVV